MKVAVAIILDTQKRVLLTKRAPHVPHGGAWEFPGGKLEAYETPRDALLREILEELNVEVLHANFLGEVAHQYIPGQTVYLHVFLVTDYRGEAVLCAGQTALRWVPLEELSDYDFPAANREILLLLNATSTSIKLP